MLSFQKTLVIVIELRKQKSQKSNQSNTNTNPSIPVKNTTKNFKTSQICLQYKLIFNSKSHKIRKWVIEVNQSNKTIYWPWREAAEENYTTSVTCLYILAVW